MNKTMEIRCVFFDIGGVLVDVDSSRAVEKLSKKLDVSTERIRQAMSFQLLNDYEKGLLTSNQFYEEMLIGCDSAADMDLETFKAFWQDVLFPRADSIDLLKRMVAKMPVWLLSNTNDFHYDLLMSDFPFMQWVTGGTYSFLEGSMKPEPLIYEVAIKRSGFLPGEILFIDDLQANILGAEAAGIRTIQFQDHDQLCREIKTRYPELGEFL